MYKCLKEKGNNQNVIVENTETKAQVIIGRLTEDILKILDLYDDPDLDNKVRATWEMEITTEQARALSEKAMKISKPVRDQSKKTVKKEVNKKIDAMDVLLGLASYK